MATIKIDPDRIIGSVDPRIYGAFMEHLDQCIYRGVVDQDSPLSDASGFRQDVIEAIRGLSVPVIRWPGGNFASGYHWVDGVGPKERRPRRMDLAWHVEEPNTFGTDEFIRYCRLVGAEPYICVNLGSGTLDEAQAWVEYCNGTGSTYWADLRRHHGYEEPYDVKYWGLGNEMYGPWQIGALEAEDYAKKARECAKMMKWTDPSIQLVSCGESGWSEWDRVVLKALAPLVQFHSIHIYTGSDEYYNNVSAPHQAEWALRICQALIEQVRYEQRIEHPIYVAYDEWNVFDHWNVHEPWDVSRLWTRPAAGERAEPVPQAAYTLAHALAVATYLNIFIRQCTTVRMANLALLVNALAPIITSPSGLFHQTIYHPLCLYATHMRGTALDLHVDCGTYTVRPEDTVSARPHRMADQGPFKVLDAAATHDTVARQMTLAVVNRDRDQSVQTEIRFVDGASPSYATVYEVTGADVDAANSFEWPHAVEPRQWRLELGEQSFSYRFSPHSLTLLRMTFGSDA